MKAATKRRSDGATKGRGWVLAALLAWCVLPGCREEVSLEPPGVRWGEDVCAVCGMIVSDRRFAAATVEAGEAESMRKPLFDDVGCLLDHESSAPEGTIRARWVRDFEGDGWLALEEASFLHSRSLHSPMAFGVAACADEAAVHRLQEVHPGAPLDLPTLRRRFAEGRLVIVSDEGSRP